MIRHCTDDDDLVGAWPGDIPEGGRTHCGMTFDDALRSTICPHPELGPTTVYLGDGTSRTILPGQPLPRSEDHAR